MRETERRAREAEGQPEPEQKRFTREIHPDLAEALAAAEDTLAAALGQPVKVRPRGEAAAGWSSTSTRPRRPWRWPSGSSPAPTCAPSRETEGPATEDGFLVPGPLALAC